MNKTQTVTTSKSHTIYTIAVIGFIYTLHLVIPMYSNSSFLSLFADEQTVGYIYMAGAAVSIFGYLIAPSIIRRLGNYRTAISLVMIQAIIFYGLVTAQSAFTIAALFILQSAVVSLIALTLDIFLEVYTDSARVGAVRGLYTATLNTSWIVAPLLGSMLINGTNNFRNTYVAALAMLFPLLYLIYRNFPKFKDPNYTHLSPIQLAKHIGHNRNWIKLFSANIVLQTFYAWMTVYCPIYLNKTMGFGWEQIGIILTVMLLPFPLVQFPLGKLADNRFGEKEIMSLGFLLMGLTTVGLAFIRTPNLLIWAAALFTTRIGAAAAEIMMETYFFKTVSPRDSAALGVFRITRPLSYFFAPLVTMAGLLFTTNEYMFAVVGVLTLLALYPALTIRDTN
ncbi:MFS transporter [Patescibacteria group bacterium]|nr:MFS transporter [Patescibacteria group bacterium]MDE1946563.1 MFS transporter [Patescibacteria group bacterium]MDE2010876.1 MFS transporter [Patescibacteria group bacterium]MDE2232760.1 MFS transporter [Patescibacteria group bacterium]